MGAAVQCTSSLQLLSAFVKNKIYFANLSKVIGTKDKEMKNNYPHSFKARDSAQWSECP